MSTWESYLLATLILAALINLGHWRALAWLAIGATNYLVTSAYYDAGLPLHPLFTACADALVCLLIYKNGAVRWELPLFTVFQFSVLASFLKLLALPSDYSYALMLEAVNWLALFIIIGAGTARLANAVGIDSGGRGRGSLHRALDTLLAPARQNPWWWAAWAFSKAP